MASFCLPAARRFRGWALTACLLAAGSPAQAQSRFDSWTIEDGLPQNSVNDIHQTRDGYLWLATFGGLVRFDGVRFVVFDRSVPGIGSLRIRALHEDRTGTLWAATEDGMLIRHRDGVFRTFAREDGLPHEGAFRIDEDDEGHLWITWQETITRYDGARFVNRRAGGFPRGVRNRAPPHFGGPTVVWWSEDADGLHCLSLGRVEPCLPAAHRPRSPALAVSVDFAGTRWVHLRSGEVVQLPRGGRPRRRDGRAGLPEGEAVPMAFYEDRQGQVWTIIARSGNVYRTGDGRTDLVARNLLSLHEDREGSIWIGTTAGLLRLRGLTISHYSMRDGLSSDNVYAMLRDRSGDVWIGTLGGGVSRYRAGRFTAYHPADGLPTEYVTAIHESPSGRLWVGTTGGLSYFDRGRFHPDPTAGLGLAGSVWAMHTDRSGRLWLGTDRGLVRREGDRITRYTVADGLAHDTVMALHEDRSGALWAGTARGLTRLAGGTFTSYTERDGFIGNYVRAFHEDDDGVLWVGTYDGGLYRLDRGRLTRFTTQTGLHDNGVFQILDDGQGYFWMGSNRGISRVSRRELNDFAAGRIRSVRPTVFGLRDGLATLECNGGRQPSGLRMDDGRLWFPTQAGIAVVDAKAVRANPVPPPVLIETVRVQGDPVSFRAGVTAGPGRDSVEVRYTALTYVKPEQVRFRYRLAGLDDDWVDAGDRRTAAYYRLPPGPYEFEVIAANSDGVWSRVSDRVSIVIEAPVWRRAWFMASAGAGLVGVLVALDRRRAARQRRERERQRVYARQLLETQEGERRRISTDLHDSLGQSLLLIRAEARSAAGDEGPQGRALEAIATVAGDAYAELKDIAYHLRPYQLDKIGVSRTIQGLVRRLDGASGVSLDAEIIDIDDAVPAGGAIDVYRIVQEGLSNIVRHSGASRGRVAVRRDNGSVEIEIADDGCGFDPSAWNQHGPSWGLGLMSLEERARSLNGRVAVRSQPGGGTTIHVRFPASGAADA